MTFSRPMKPAQIRFILHTRIVTRIKVDDEVAITLRQAHGVGTTVETLQLAFSAICTKRPVTRPERILCAARHAGRGRVAGICDFLN